MYIPFIEKPFIIAWDKIYVTAKCDDKRIITGLKGVLIRILTAEIQNEVRIKNNTNYTNIPQVNFCGK